jgi:hypothetical protein
MKPICVICTEEFLADSKISVIHCGHPFHEVCLNNWLSNGQNNTCPQCRYIATPETVIKKLFFTEPESPVKKSLNDEPVLIKNRKDKNYKNIFREADIIYKKYRDEINNNILNPNKYCIKSRLNVPSYAFSANKSLEVNSNIQIFKNLRSVISQKQSTKAHKNSINNQLIKWLPCLIGFILVMFLMFVYSSYGINSNLKGSLI